MQKLRCNGYFAHWERTASEFYRLLFAAIFAACVGALTVEAFWWKSLFFPNGRSRRPGQSWRTFVRNQAIAFRQYSKERSRGYAHLHVLSSWAQLKRSGAVQLATLWVGLRRGLGRQQPAVNVGRIGLRSAQRDCGVTHRAAAAPGGSRRALYNRFGAALPIRSPPRQLGAAIAVAAADSKRRVVAESRQNS